MFKQNISFEVWGGENGKYRLLDDDKNPIDKTPEDTCDRVAKALSDLELPDKREFWYKEFRSILGTRFAGGGRIMANVGAGQYKKETSAINCTTMKQIPDSMAGIMDVAKDAALTLKAGCGVGYDFSTIRPKGSHVFGAGAGTSGVISFMKIFDAICSTILSGGARRGAQMACLDIQSPEIEDFITAKRQDGVLRYFNCSVLVTDRFMQAVEEDKEWDLWFWEKDRSQETLKLSDVCLIKQNDIPYNHSEFKYFQFDKNHCEVEYGNCTKDTIFKKRIFKTVKAKELYDLIMRSTYNFWEPGFLLIDRANIENNLYFCEIFRATNPCFAPDTLIAVADGRGYVSIKQLAEEGKDVPVYSMDKTGKVSIKIGRNPRLTDWRQPYCEIKFEDNSTLEVTYHHEFILTDGKRIKAENLEPGNVIPGYNPEIHPELKNLICEDLNENISNGIRNCENCGVSFVIPHISNRQISFCSESCLQNSKNTNVLCESINTGCNRKIKSVQQCFGYIDVFNITVDENHTLATANLINKDGNSYYLWTFVPNCGEQFLAPLASCLLGSMILPSYVLKPFWPHTGLRTDNFDWQQFRSDIRTASRLLDNVVEINNLPIEEMKEQIIVKRRHGLGFTGLGSALNILCMPYGSDDSLQFAEQISLIIAQESLYTNIELAKEKGCAPIFLTQEARKAVLESVYLKRLIDSCENKEQIIKDILDFGLRYSHATCVAPTGTLSLTWGNNCSGGIEPEIADSYFRNIRDPKKKTKTQEEVMSYSYFMWKEKCKDTGIEFKNLPDYWRTTKDLSVYHHLNMQAVVQKWMDSSISKTINVPTDYPFEDFKKIYLEGWKLGLKGVTTYRPNASIGAGVLTQKSDLDATTYTFTLEDGREVSFLGSETVEYDGESHNVANLYDALKEGIYGNM